MLHVIHHPTMNKFEGQAIPFGLWNHTCLMDVRNGHAKVRVYQIPAMVYKSIKYDIKLLDREPEDHRMLRPPKQSYILVGVLSFDNFLGGNYCTIRVPNESENLSLEMQMQLLCCNMDPVVHNGVTYGKGLNLIVGSDPNVVCETTQPGLDSILVNPILEITSLARFRPKVRAWIVPMRVFQGEESGMSDNTPHNYTAFLGVQDVLVVKTFNTHLAYACLYNPDIPLQDYLSQMKDLPTFAYGGNMYGRGRYGSIACWWKDVP